MHVEPWADLSRQRDSGVGGIYAARRPFMNAAPHSLVIGVGASVLTYCTVCGI